MRSNLMQAQIIRTVWITPTTFVIRFLMDEEFRYRAGQAISIVLPPFFDNNPSVSGLYPLSSSPIEARAFGHEIVVKWSSGDVASNYLLQLKPNDIFFASGPYGGLRFLPQDPNRDTVMLGAGQGIATMKSLIGSEEFRRCPPERTFCVQGVTRMEERILPKYFHKRGVHLISCTSREVVKSHEATFPGRITEYLRFSEVPWNWQTALFYVMGREDVVKDIVTVLRVVKRIPLERIVIESVPPISQDPVRDLSLPGLGRTNFERKAG